MLFRTHSFARYLLSSLVGAAIVTAFSLVVPLDSAAQTRRKTTGKGAAKPATKKPDVPEITHLPDLPPFRAEARVYQARAPQGSYAPLNDQLYRLTTANLDDEEKWINAFGKVYPGFEFGLVQSAPLRVYRTSRPARLTLGRAMGRGLEICAYGAFNNGDNVTPGTTMVIEVNLDFGRPEQLAIAIQTIDVEEGKTYFFAVPGLKFSPSEYAQFLRPGMPVAPFEGQDTFLIVSFSVQLNPPAVTAIRTLDEKGATEFQAKATKKVVPEIVPSLTSAGLGGRVRVFVEVAPEGRVRHAVIVSSSLPEMNKAVLAAARQWEFPVAEFAADPRPIGSVLVFDFPVSPGNVPR